MTDEAGRVLVVEDEKPMLLGLVDSLRLEGFEVFTAEDGREGLEKAKRLRPDAVILDVMLPKLSGIDVCQALRASGHQVPILILSARSQESDKVLALGVGADDYVTKPFSVNELMARIRALLRRASAPARDIDRYEFGSVELDFLHMAATKAGEPVALSHLEFEVMRYLIQHNGVPVSREELLREVWKYSSDPTTRAVDNLVARLRKKLEDAAGEPCYLLTIHGYGYKFVD